MQKVKTDLAWMDGKDLERNLERKMEGKDRSIIRLSGMREAVSVP